MLSLLDGSYKNRRVLRFDVDGGQQPIEVCRVVINSLERADGTGEIINFVAVHRPFRNEGEEKLKAITGVYNTRTRKGSMSITR